MHGVGRMNALYAIALAAAFLLAGCSGSGSDTDVAMTEPVPTTTAPMDPMPGVPAVPPPVVAECAQTRTQAGTPLGYGAHVDRALLGIEDCILNEMFTDDLTAFASGLVEVTWSDLQATATNVNAWVESSDCQAGPLAGCGLPYETGTTAPLQIVLDRDFLEEWGESELALLAAAEGVAVQQEFRFYVTMFPGDMPPGYTAVPE